MYVLNSVLDLIYLPTYQYNEIKLSMKQLCMSTVHYAGRSF